MPNHALQRTRPSRPGCNRTPSWAGVAELGSFGGIVLCAGARANGTASLRRARTLLVWHGGLLLMMCALVLTLKNYPNWQRTAGFYKVSCAIYPAVLLAMGQGSPGRWRATRTALVYMTIVCAMVWLLPLFPARPLTAPIHNPTDHMMPLAFPLLLVLPAVVMDLLRIRFPLPTTREWGEISTTTARALCP